MVCITNRWSLNHAPIRFCKSFSTLGVYQELDETNSEDIILVEKVGNYTFHIL